MAELNGVRPVNQRNVTISESLFKNLMRLASENIIPVGSAERQRARRGAELLHSQFQSRCGQD